MDRQEKIRVLRRQAELHPDSELAKAALEQELGIRQVAETRPAPPNYRHELRHFRIIVRLIAIAAIAIAFLISASAVMGGTTIVGAIILFVFGGALLRVSFL